MVLSFFVSLTHRRDHRQGMLSVESCHLYKVVPPWLHLHICTIGGSLHEYLLQILFHIRSHNVPYRPGWGPQRRLFWHHPQFRSNCLIHYTGSTHCALLYAPLGSVSACAPCNGGGHLYLLNRKYHLMRTCPVSPHGLAESNPGRRDYGSHLEFAHCNPW